MGICLPLFKIVRGLIEGENLECHTKKHARGKQVSIEERLIRLMKSLFNRFCRHSRAWTFRKSFFEVSSKNRPIRQVEYTFINGFKNWKLRHCRSLSGNEVIHYTLVDPDNRRPINYEERQELLRKIPKNPLLDPKLFLQWKALCLDVRINSFFLKVNIFHWKSRKAQKSLIAFARRHGGTCVIVIAGRFFERFLQERVSLNAEIWKGTDLCYPTI